jgi:hypothetical protein
MDVNPKSPPVTASLPPRDFPLEPVPTDPVAEIPPVPMDTVAPAPIPP